MKKREAEFTIYFRHWLKANPMHTAAFELKQTTADSLPFNSVSDHQINALLAVSSSGLLYKIPDDSRGIKPFDMVYFRNELSYIVVKFPKHFEIISINTWILERGRSKRKSLTSERAKEISVISVKIK